MFKYFKTIKFSKLILLFALSGFYCTSTLASEKLYLNLVTTISDPKPIKIEILPQSADILFTSVDLKYTIKNTNGNYGFTVYYLITEKNQLLVDYTDLQFTQEIHATRAALIIISKLKKDSPLEIKGEELNSIFR